MIDFCPGRGVGPTFQVPQDRLDLSRLQSSQRAAQAEEVAGGQVREVLLEAGL